VGAIGIGPANLPVRLGGSWRGQLAGGRLCDCSEAVITLCCKAIAANRCTRKPAARSFSAPIRASSTEVLSQGLLAYTSKTLRGDLLLELATVRSRGYATEHYEHDTETRAIASPVRDHAGRITACITAILDSDNDPGQASAHVCGIADAFTTELAGQPREDH
jgi:hypothetical protein